MSKRIYYQYKDKQTGRIIESDNIVADDDRGVIEHIDGASFRFIPKENLNKKPIAADYGYDKEAAPELKEAPDVSPYNKTKLNDTPKLLGEYYDYSFGINKIELKQTVAKKVSGFISSEVKTGNVDYIEISADVSSKNSSIEYYVIDGIKEIPILPVEDSIIFREKLFPDLNTRFLPNLNKNITVYKDGEISPLSFNDIKTLDFNRNEYSISYYPVKDPHRYIPENRQIKIKIIERCLKKEVPAIINSIVILKYGGDNIWNTLEQNR